MSLINYMVWAADPDLAEFWGLTIRWYGLLFASGFLISQQILFRVFRAEGHQESDVETLTVYMVIATILGARLGHVFFYEPARYLSNPIDILKIWEGGLASHGAAFGILFALFLYSNYNIRLFKGTFQKHLRPGQSFLWVVDRIVIVVALTGALIRFGNFMNSEIEGLPTESDYGVIFAWNAKDAILSSSPSIEEVEVSSDTDRASVESISDEYRPVTFTITFKNANYPEEEIRYLLEDRVKSLFTNYQSIRKHIYEPAGTPLDYTLTQDRGAYIAEVNTYGIPRHPAQLYESATTFLTFLFLLFLWYRMREKTPEGLLLGLFLIINFGLRFVHEYFKENQVEFEDDLLLNMGQWLSIPLILAGIYLLIQVGRRSKKHANQ
ncbi:prolipoprotein diacylglyceryl transferase [Catalinimonas niigatensis]|uniref:prolipoprotein diacylglyceryl transferase n=1 Tax=Catalinimonas niigatensis TaxID=1397264 RepID=UPI002666D8EA|nr:prolipoprotein diacylglyceryl transferase [Catalinimonas niigatensis]WPP50129.1 prolipoprotein diacylglyceryl transferase [Catalinimonas niigatensis]